MVVVVAAAESEGGQRNSGFTLALNHVNQFIGTGYSDIEIAIGGENDPIDAIGAKILSRHLVSKPDTAGAVGGAPGFKTLQGVQDGGFFCTRSGRQHHAGSARVDHEANGVVSVQLPGQQAQRVAQQRQFVRRLHGAGDIDQEHQVGRRKRFCRHLVTLDADAQQMGFRIPGGRGYFGVDPEGLLPVRGAGIGVVEVIDEFFHANRVFGWQRALVQPAAHVAVSPGIDIDGEGGYGLF